MTDSKDSLSALRQQVLNTLNSLLAQGYIDANIGGPNWYGQISQANSEETLNNIHSALNAIASNHTEIQILDNPNSNNPSQLYVERFRVDIDKFRYHP